MLKVSTTAERGKQCSPECGLCLVTHASVEAHTSRNIFTSQTGLDGDDFFLTQSWVGEAGLDLRAIGGGER